jgi:hypothetical protein
MVAKEQAAMFLGSRGDNVVRAFLFAKRMGFEAEPYLAIAWRHLNARGVPKIVREGPDKCVGTDTTLIWCFVRGTPARANPLTFQCIVAKDSNPTLVFDVVADHFQDLDRRLFVTAPSAGIKKATSEYATLCIDHDSTTIQPKGRFTISSARKSRMYKAHLDQSGLSDLLIDRRVLTAFYENEPYDKNRAVLAFVANMENGDRTTVMGMLKAAIASKRRRLAQNNKAKPSARRLTSGLGIAKKTPISDSFANFLEKSCGIVVDRSGDSPAIARTDVVSAMPKYIKGKQLNKGRVVCYEQDPEGIKLLLPDGFDQEITFFSLYKHINHHFNPNT